MKQAPACPLAQGITAVSSKESSRATVSLHYSGLQLAVNACGQAQALLLYLLNNHMPHNAIHACTPGKACAAKQLN